MWCPASPVAFVAECGVIVQDVAHLARVVLPVRGQPPDSAEPHPGGDKIGEVWAEQPPLAVPRLVPWVGEEHTDLINRVGRDEVPQSGDRIRFDNPYVGDARGSELSQHAGDCWPVDLESEHV